ncbi:MAG: response regulator [Gemmatimonadaceae bacterium]|nr:response regulator [Gemmatimonadaceae bacterium]
MTAAEPLVLVVDDDAAIRRTLKRALEFNGFRVEEAEHGADALKRAAELGEAPALLLTDVVMPVMGGVALAEQMLAAARPPRVILMSGLAHDPSRLVVAGSRPPFLAKPFDLNEVLKVVTATLATPA